MKLSVIIPCYNAADTIAIQLEALASQHWRCPWEVIIVDNRSTDASNTIVEHYREKLPHLKIVDASARQGQPYALNVGAQAATSEALVFCDADDEVGIGWVRAIGEALSQYDFVASRFDTEKLNARWLAKSRANPQRNGLKLYEYPPFLPHAGGGGLGVKRALFEAVDGFDESLPFLHDTDFCWRVQLTGVRLQFVPEAIYHVRFRDTFPGIYRQARNYAEYNVLLYKRYRPLGMPTISWKDSARTWWNLLRRIPHLRRKVDIARWIWKYGWCMGRLQGSLKYRVFAL